MDNHNLSYQSAHDTTSGQGMDENLADYDKMTDNMTAIYLHNRPLFITYNCRFIHYQVITYYLLLLTIHDYRGLREG
jgi:hypothetical protein